MAKKRANGEGSIRKRADGRWEGRYTAGYHPETGKRIIKNVLGKTQAECKAKLKKAIEESQALDISRANEYTVATWLRTWFELYAKPHIRPSTMNYYHRNIEQHVAPAIGDIPLNKLAAPCGICYIRAASTVEYNKPIQEVRSRKDGKQVVGIGERTVCTHGSFVEGDRPCFQAK